MDIQFLISTIFHLTQFFWFLWHQYKYNISFLRKLILLVVFFFQETFYELVSGNILGYYSSEWINFCIKIFYDFNLWSIPFVTVWFWYEWIGKSECLTTYRKTATFIMSLLSFSMFWYIGYAAGYVGLYEQFLKGMFYVAQFIKNFHGCYGIGKDAYSTITFLFIKKNISEEVKVLEKHVFAVEESTKELSEKLKTLREKNECLSSIHKFQIMYDRSNEHLNKLNGELLEKKAKEKQLNDAETWRGFFMLWFLRFKTICGAFKIGAAIRGFVICIKEDKVNMNDTVTSFIKFLNYFVTWIRDEPLDRGYWAWIFSLVFSTFDLFNAIFGNVLSFEGLLYLLQNNFPGSVLFLQITSYANFFSYTKRVPGEFQPGIKQVLGDIDYIAFYWFSDKIYIMILIIVMIVCTLRCCFFHVNRLRDFENFFSCLFTLFFKALEKIICLLVRLADIIIVLVPTIYNILMYLMIFRLMFYYSFIFRGA